MTKYEKLDEAFDVEPTEVEVTERKIERSNPVQRISRKITNTPGVISIRSLRKGRKLSMASLNWLKRVRCLVHMKSQVS
jgi:hypothetical protein